MVLSGTSSMDRARWRGGKTLDLRLGDFRSEFQSNTVYSEGFHGFPLSLQAIMVLEHRLGD
jgi:hypothetical protein